MGALRIALFGGRVPKLEPHLLPDTAAQQATNCKLSSGSLRPWWKPAKVGDLPFAGARSVYRYLHDGVRKLLAFRNHTTVTESALVNDSHGRIYYSDDTGFYITTKDDIAAGLPASRVGVPSPVTGTLQVHTQGGNSNTVETRVYAATLVSKYGEESAPGRTFTASGSADGLWQIKNLDQLYYDAGLYPNVEKVRLYRTISSGTGTDYRMVEEWVIGDQPALYNDVKTASEIASAFAMSSLGWAPPPDELQGVIAVSGGFNAGFYGRTVCFSVPYYPHSWPEDYRLNVDDDIVGIGYFDNTVVILTTGPVAYALGTQPDAMTLIRNGQVAPCLSARSIASTTGAVLFASTEGLYMVSSAGVQNISQAFVTKDEWSQLNPSQLIGAVYETKYLGFYSDSLGFSFQFDDPTTAWTDVQLQGITAVITDRTSNRILLAVGTEAVEWDGATNTPLTYSWRSKPLQLPKPSNFGALQLRGAFLRQDPGRPVNAPLPDPLLDDPLGYGQTGVNAVAPVDGPAAVDNYDPNYRSVYVRVFGDGELVWSGRIADEAPERLPSDNKCHQWEVELTGSVPVTSVALATTFKALEEVP